MLLNFFTKIINIFFIKKTVFKIKICVTQLLSTEVD